MTNGLAISTAHHALRSAARLAVVVVALLGIACRVPSGAPVPDLGPSVGALSFGYPDEEGMDARPLIELADWVLASPTPILSILVSHRGRVVFELYTSGIVRDEAHYVMSVTKSVTSALMGVAIDQRIVDSAATSIAAALPPEVFASPTDRERFTAVTIRDALGMSALDAEVPPHRNLPADVQRQNDFLASPNRVKFALTQALLPNPGTSFQYTDITPYLATGILEYRTNTTELDFAEQNLFTPMAFENYEWMHEDPSGIDNGAYGLRLRPVDMQRFGLLFLQSGIWNGAQLISSSWVAQSFLPWIKSSPTLDRADYGWYWWTFRYGTGWKALVADGWKGQRIAIFPDQELVVTMTAIIEASDGDEDAIFRQVIESYVKPAVVGPDGSGPQPDPSLRDTLLARLSGVNLASSRIGPNVEDRMIPSIPNKEKHRPFMPK